MEASKESDNIIFSDGRRRQPLRLPWASFLILERRSNIGGTWDFFKYPGIRSDSDMFTFGLVNVASDYSCFYTEQTDINVYFGGFDNHAICKAFFLIL